MHPALKLNYDYYFDYFIIVFCVVGLSWFVQGLLEHANKRHTICTNTISLVGITEGNSVMYVVDILSIPCFKHRALGPVQMPYFT